MARYRNLVYGLSGNGNGHSHYWRKGRPIFPKYAKMGWDFPRRYIDITPDEVLYDPDRVLGTRVAARLKPSGQTALHQPRVETSNFQQVESINDCPPPSQLPYIKRQIHLDPSRDAETFFCSDTVDVPAGGTAIALPFDTFPTLRTEIRWVDVQVHDALSPSLLTVQIRVECEPRKFIACPKSPETVMSGGAACVFGAGTVSSPTALDDLMAMPKDFHNVLMEITDRRHVDFFLTNTAPVDRRISISAWGWIESITAWDETVKR